MGDINGIAKAIFTHRDATDITVANGIDGFALYPIGLNIDAAMKVMGTGLTKITRQ